MKQIFISFSTSQNMHDAKSILSNKGYEGKICQKNHLVLEYEIYPEKEVEILGILDWYHIWVDVYESFEEFLNAQ